MKIRPAIVVFFIGASLVNLSAFVQWAARHYYAPTTIVWERMFAIVTYEIIIITVTIIAWILVPRAQAK